MLFTLGLKAKASNMSMVVKMFFLTLKKKEIFNSIIFFVMINMMNYFTFFKVSSYFSFHDISMFTYITITVCLWMVFNHNPSIPSFGNYSSTIPSRRFFHNKLFASPNTLAFHGTVNPSFRLRFRNKELFFASNANHFYVSASPICRIFTFLKFMLAYFRTKLSRFPISKKFNGTQNTIFKLCVRRFFYHKNIIPHENGYVNNLVVGGLL